MGSYNTTNLEDLISDQIRLLNSGKPLEAFDAFYSDGVCMYANDDLFATGAIEGRAKQEPFISSATSIEGHITDLCVSAVHETCVFRNQSKFKNAKGEPMQINGLCWQRWDAGKIVEERYYDGARMEELIEMGVLSNPSDLQSIILSQQGEPQHV